MPAEQHVEIIGATLSSLLENLRADEIRPYLKKHGLEHIDPEKWYPAALWLAVFEDLKQETNAVSNMVAVGMSIANKVILPPELEEATAPEILTAWGHIYDIQHRGADAGKITTEKISDNEYQVVLSTLYPDDLEYGVAYGFVKRFSPPGTAFSISYANESDRRARGGDVTILSVVFD